MALVATFAAKFDQFEASLKNASVHLQVFDRAVKTSTRGLTREIESFSGQKVAVEAARMAEAVFQLGNKTTIAAGLVKLLPEELKRVSAAMELAAQKAGVLGEKLPPSIQKMRDEIAKLPAPADAAAKSISSMGPAANAAAVGFGKLVASFVSAQAIIGAVKSIFNAYVDFIKSSIQSFANAESAQIKLNAAVRAQGTATPEVIRQYNALAASFQRTTVFADDLLMEMQGLLVQVGNVMPHEMEGALKAATDLASGLGIDLRAATMLVGKAFEGETGTLKRYGIVVDEAKLKTQGITAVLEAVQQKFGGQAQAEVNTYAGQIKQLGNAWDDLKERMGEFVVKSREVQGIMGALNRILQDMTREGGNAETAIGGLFQRWNDITDVIHPMIPGLQQWNKLINELADAAERARMAAAIPALKMPVPPALPDISSKGLEVFNKQLEDNKKHTDAAKSSAENFARVQEGLFSRDIIGRVDVMSRALGAVSNITKLTVEKKRELHTAVTQAIAAYVALGQQAPAKLAEIIRLTTDLITVTRAFSSQSSGAWVPLKEGIRDAGRELQNIAAGLEGNGDLISRSLNEAALATKAADDAFNEWAKTNGVLITTIDDTRDGINEATEATRTWQQNLSGLSQAFVNLAHVSDGALGAVVGGIARVLTALDAGVASVKSFRDGLEQFKSGNLFSGALGIATGVAGMVGAVASLLKGWFGVSKAVQQSRSELEGFQEILRGTLTDTQRSTLQGWQQDIVAISKAYVMMGRTVKEAEAAAAAMWDTDNPERSKRAIEEINRVLKESARLFDEAKESAGELFGDITNLAGDAGGIPDFLRPYIDQMEELGLLTKQQAKSLRDLGDSGATNWSKVKEAADKYGVRLESLGTAFNAQRIIGDATGIINAFDMITKAGGDVGGVLFDMQEEISKVVQDALKFGTEIPENMKPWIEELKRAGFLVDEHGEKIEDLGAIKYGEKIKTEAEKSREAFEKIVEKIQELIDKITGPLMDALDDIPRDIRIKAGVDYDSGTLPPPRDDVARPTSSALGGRVSAALARSSGGGGGVYHVHVDVDGRQVTQVVIDRLGNRLSLLGGR